MEMNLPYAPPANSIQTPTGGFESKATTSYPMITLFPFL